MTSAALDPADERVLQLAVDLLEPDREILTPTPSVAERLHERGIAARLGHPREEPPASLDAVALIGGELAAAGDHAEGLLAASAEALRAGGVLLAAAPNRVHHLALGQPPSGRAWSADELERTVGHPGLAIEAVHSPGAAAALRGDPSGAPDPELDRLPGLLDAGPRTLVVARRPADSDGRSSAFFASVPRKIIAAAVICRDPDGRLLVVHDSFRRHWTIPGGVVDADEDPRAGAVREAYEEAGLRVEGGPLLGVFAQPWPDRLLLVYGAEPIGPIPQDLAPVHAHEIDAVRWLPLDEALRILNPRTAGQVRRCLDHPGESWDDHRA